MKRIFSFASALLLFVTIFSVSIVSAAPEVEIRAGETIFIPQKEQRAPSSDNASTFANPMGRIDCEPTSAGGAICDWRVAAGLKKINYSNVKVTFEKLNRATFTWEYVSQQTFNYPVNPAKSVIEDQASIGMLSSGFYRATLGGTITTRNGTYVASAESPATFTIEHTC
ncbi:hypothetical protein [Paenibacillus dendritiformis]|uniref:hypothetical protein n=1 Tax=Paenibacillus dendritiformis TaxID=130049 RepID=UPI0018CEBADB|nr:hypothetical protein [Paenibacillus dendritiformis]